MMFLLLALAAAAALAPAVSAERIHEDAAASYPFSQVAGGDLLPAFVLAPLRPSALKLSGWLRRDVALALLERCGLELDALKQRARSPSFRAFPVEGAQRSASGDVRATDVVSHNVIARLPGATRPNEYVLYGAHWDANGRDGPDARGDGVRNGAVDNATGTAELLAIARAFARGPRSARTLVFAGGGRTDLENRLADAAARVGLCITPEPNPEAGWYFRSDHFPFAKHGVPAIAFRAGRDLVAGGTVAGNAWVEAYNARHHHQTPDEFDPGWNAGIEVGALRATSDAERLTTETRE